MTDAWYILELNVEPWSVGPLSVGRKGGKLFPIVGRDQQLHAYKEAVKAALTGATTELMEGKLKLSIWFWRTQATYKTSQARTHRKHEADATNLFKATEDALQGILYKNDKDNIETHAYIVAQGPDVDPLIVIHLEQVTEDPETAAIGAFPDVIYQALQEYKTRAVSNDLLQSNQSLKDDDGDWVSADF